MSEPPMLRGNGFGGMNDGYLRRDHGFLQFGQG